MKSFKLNERDKVINEIGGIQYTAYKMNLNCVIMVRKDIFDMVNVYYSMFSDYADAEIFVKHYDEKFKKIGMPYVIYFNDAIYTNEQSFDWED